MVTGKNSIKVSISSPKTRETYKDEAVKVRESGNLLTSLEMFREILKWDESNKKPQDQMDTLGHIRICYTRLADELETKTPNEAKKLRYQALEAVEMAMKIGKKYPKLKDASAIQKVHFASASYDLTKYISNKVEKRKVLEKAYKIIKQAIKELPGSKAHKAWPANTKAKIEYDLGLKEEAIKTLTDGERLIFEGYADEFAHQKDAELKFGVWLSGLHLTQANIAIKEKMPLLAKHYATSVIMTLDPKNVLGERKKEAQRIIDSLK